MVCSTVLIVDKSGTIKESVIKSYNETELYKKAGFKTADDFKCRAQWNIENINQKSYSIYVYGKITGRANQENKYDFPPPIDNTLMFGSCVIVNKDKDGNPTSITEKEWDSIYEYLFGGFDDIDDKDSEDEDDDDDEDLPMTKDGYVKDGFIVDDDDEDDDFEEEEEEEDDDYDEDDDEDDYKPKSKKSTKNSAKSSAKSNKLKKKPMEPLFTKVSQPPEEETYLDCTSELSEEEYLED